MKEQEILKIGEFFENISASEFKAFLSGKETTEIPSGEYHRNFRIKIGNKPYLLRVNHGSQMHLENQMEYEFSALKNLYPSGRTPFPYYFNDEKKIYPHVFIVEEFLAGRPLDYITDMDEAASILADIHSLPFPRDNILIESHNPHEEIFEEAESMFGIYRKNHHSSEEITELIEGGFRILKSEAEKLKILSFEKSIINTELNSHNFIIGNDGKGFLIDWEKPLLGNPLQDLGHFLAPTTTFWRTEIILREEEKEKFLSSYEKRKGSILSDDERKYLDFLIRCNCLRGITWCSMAYVQYLSENKEIRNTAQFEKIKKYLEEDFIRNYLPS